MMNILTTFVIYHLMYSHFVSAQDSIEGSVAKYDEIIDSKVDHEHDVKVKLGVETFFMKPVHSKVDDSLLSEHKLNLDIITPDLELPTPDELLEHLQVLTHADKPTFLERKRYIDNVDSTSNNDANGSSETPVDQPIHIDSIDDSEHVELNVENDIDTLQDISTLFNDTSLDSADSNSVEEEVPNSHFDILHHHDIILNTQSIHIEEDTNAFEISSSLDDSSSSSSSNSSDESINNDTISSKENHTSNSSIEENTTHNNDDLKSYTDPIQPHTTISATSDTTTTTTITTTIVSNTDTTSINDDSSSTIDASDIQDIMNNNTTTDSRDRYDDDDDVTSGSIELKEEISTSIGDHYLLTDDITMNLTQGVSDSSIMNNDEDINTSDDTVSPQASTTTTTTTSSSINTASTITSNSESFFSDELSSETLSDNSIFSSLDKLNDESSSSSLEDIATAESMNIEEGQEDDDREDIDSELEAIQEVNYAHELMLELQQLEEEESEEYIQQQDAALVAEAERIAAEEEKKELERRNVEILEKKRLAEERERQRHAENKISDRIRSTTTGGGGGGGSSSSSSQNTRTTFSQQTVSPGMADMSSRRMSGGLGGSTTNMYSGTGSLSDKLFQSQNLLIQKEKQLKEKEKFERMKKFKISRTHARIVEKIIKVYNDDSTSLYDVLGVKMSVKDDELRRLYRHLAFALHPDRNPHPDAKQAFDYVVEAFETLINPADRRAYNRRVIKKNEITMKKIKQKIQFQIKNWKARTLLFIHRMKHGQWKEEYTELISDKVKQVTEIVTYEKDKFILAPSKEDKYSIMLEYVEDHGPLSMKIISTYVTCLHVIPFVFHQPIMYLMYAL